MVLQSEWATIARPGLFPALRTWSARVGLAPRALSEDMLFTRWVRPYLVESTTSRPICEVKQPQAPSVLRSGMTPGTRSDVPFSICRVEAAEEVQRTAALNAKETAADGASLWTVSSAQRLPSAVYGRENVQEHHPVEHAVADPLGPFGLVA